MRKYWNNVNRVIRTFKLSTDVFKLLAFSTTLLALLILCWIFYPGMASSGPYLNSAHGNSDYGVNRPRTGGFGYTIGNCAHCHEQHASINGQTLGPFGYELFYDHWIGACDLFCYRCHSSLAGVEQHVNNYLYSCNYGGESCTTYVTVRQHFCDNDSDNVRFGSKHNLAQIRTIIKNNGYGWGFPADPDPCSACHNPHLSQTRGNKQYQSFVPSHTAIVRPSEHTSNPLNLWGDNANETMLYYAQHDNGGTYQSPCYGSNNNIACLYEPAGDGTYDGSNLPDYVTFCLDCHQYQQHDPERSAVVKAIAWGPTGDRHGGYQSNDCSAYGLNIELGSERLPYVGPYNYVLSCTDCHEPHAGRKRIHLIRRFINGEAVAAGISSGDNVQDGIAICTRCHNVNEEHLANATCINSSCHGHGVKWGGEGPCLNKPNF